MGADNRDKMFDMILDASLVTRNKISGADEIRLLNEVKDELFNALTAFSPDLPSQYSTQIESHVIDMRDKTDTIWEPSELEGVLKLYKLKLEFLAGMLHKDKHEAGDIHKEEKHDDMDNIRAKVNGYEDKFMKVYNKIMETGLDNIDLDRLKILIQVFAGKNAEKVDRLEKPKASSDEK